MKPFSALVALSLLAGCSLTPPKTGKATEHHANGQRTTGIYKDGKKAADLPN